ncbi:MAG: hypothetical protein HOE65_08760, partial [Rhodospirillales bacterium]|nr:hypothetical protein [Rhodospirillales bacterium]
MITRHFASALVVAVSAAAFVAAPANASFVTYDFVNYIDNPSGTGIDNSGGEHGVTEKFRITGNGGTEQLTVTAHGTNYNVATGSFETAPYAYFDDNGAGIGVCQILEDGISGKGADQCSPASDDNITMKDGSKREILSLKFDEGAQISELLFRNDGHTPTFGTNKHVLIATSDGMANLDISDFDQYLLQANIPNDGTLGAELVGLPLLTLTASTFVHIMYDDQQIYLAGLETYPVPVPAALPLFGS